MATNVIKLGSNDNEDIFTYRDDYNEEHLVKFPKYMSMTESEVENYLND
jgi:hypothetical protein